MTDEHNNFKIECLFANGKLHELIHNFLILATEISKLLWEGGKLFHSKHTLEPPYDDFNWNIFPLEASDFLSSHQSDYMGKNLIYLVFPEIHNISCDKSRNIGSTVSIFAWHAFFYISTNVGKFKTKWQLKFSNEIFQFLHFWSFHEVHLMQKYEFLLILLSLYCYKQVFLISNI